jgi:hypothetical protein
MAEPPFFTPNLVILLTDARQQKPRGNPPLRVSWHPAVYLSEVKEQVNGQVGRPGALPGQFQRLEQQQSGGSDPGETRRYLISASGICSTGKT